MKTLISRASVDSTRSLSLAAVASARPIREAAGTRLYKAGMERIKGSPWLGGTRAMSFWRWPGHIEPGDCGALAAHVDFFRTVAELAGAKLNAAAEKQVEGRSLVSLLENPSAAW